MTTVDLPDSYAPIPHQLIRTQRGDLVRLYGLLHDFGWHKQPFEVDDLASAMDTTRRTVFRYLNDLAAAGWIAYHKQQGHAGLGERITLYSSPNFELQTCDTRITGSKKPVTPGSQDLQTCDPGVTGCDTRITACDPGVTGSPDLWLPDAAKIGPQISGRSPEDPPTPTASAQGIAGGGGGGSVVSRNSTPQPTPGSAYLAATGFSSTACQQFGHYPVDVLRADVQARTSKLGQGPGAIYLAWSNGAPPGTYQPPSAPGRAAPDPQQLADRQRAAAEQASPEERQAILARHRAQKGKYGT